MCVCVYVCVCVICMICEGKSRLKSWTLCDGLSEGVTGGPPGMGQGLV